MCGISVTLDTAARRQTERSQGGRGEAIARSRDSLRLKLGRTRRAEGGRVTPRECHRMRMPGRVLRIAVPGRRNAALGTAHRKLTYCALGYVSTFRTPGAARG